MTGNKKKELDNCYLLTYHKKTEVSNYQQNQQQKHHTTVRKL